jgi:hypothetical protein
MTGLAELLVNGKASFLLIQAASGSLLFVVQ